MNLIDKFNNSQLKNLKENLKSLHKDVTLETFKNLSVTDENIILPFKWSN